jgi:hypothetical protein
MHRPDLSQLKQLLPHRSLQQMEEKRTRLRQKMGISRVARIWSKEEVSAICTERAQGLTVLDIARRHGRSLAAVTHQLLQVRRAERRLVERQAEQDAQSCPDDAMPDSNTAS